MRRVYKNLCPTTISASIMAANMWKNSLKNVESDNNKILYENLLDFFYSETVLTFWISLVVNTSCFLWGSRHVGISAPNIDSYRVLTLRRYIRFVFIKSQLGRSTDKHIIYLLLVVSNLSTTTCFGL